MAAFVNHTKFVGGGTGGTTPAIDTTGANFAIIFYTFYNGTDYPAISDNYGNDYSFNTARENVDSPAMASEFRFTHEFVGGPGHTFTIAGAGFYPGGLNGASMYVEVFSGVAPGSNAAPIFTSPWYNDGGNATPVASSLSASGGSGGGENGQIIIVGWGNTDPTNNTVITATDGLAGTPVFTITDSDKALGAINNYNAGLAYYIQPIATSTDITQTWGDWQDFFPHDGPLGQAVMSTITILPGPAPLEVALPSITAKCVMAGDDVHSGQGFGLSITGTPPPPQVPCTLQDIIPSFLYWQYNDDDDLQAFVRAYNTYAQAFLDWFNQLNLPIYTQDPVSGALLDWVAEGLYGLVRPSLGGGLADELIGPLNTYAFDELGPNEFVLSSGTSSFIITDDIFRRIITWHFYKGDCKVFDIRWLKRRIMRFLFGTDGVDFNVDQTYQISVTFGPDNQVNINFITATSSLLDLALIGVEGINELPEINGFDSIVTPLPPIPNAAIFKLCVDSGFLELPFQFTYVVNI